MSVFRFTVFDKKTQAEADPYEIALHEEWANRLCYCDMEGFVIGEDGALYLMDECGQYACCDPDRFVVRWDEMEYTTRDPDDVHIVRCKDCKYYQKVYGGVPLGEVGHCICHSFETVPEWFCADGERKEE